MRGMRQPCQSHKEIAMTISIVIPTYNGERFVEQAIQSVLNQTRQPDEIIISDDNSTDNTLEICNRYSDRLNIFCNPKGPSGFVNGWNNAISHASCEFISILHQDDILAPAFLEEIEKAYRQYPDVKHLVSNCNYIDGNGDTIRQSTHLSGETRKYSGAEYAEIYTIRGYDHINRCPGVVTHRDIFKVCKYRPEAGHIADDDFFMRVGNYTDVVCVHKPLAFYREHTASETGHLSYLEINLRLLENYYFQIGELDKNPILTYKVKDYIRREECKFIRRVLVMSIRKRNLRFFNQAVIFLYKATIRDSGKNIPLLLRKHKPQ